MLDTLICNASLIAPLVKNLPPMQETQIQFLGWEGPVDSEAWQATVYGVSRVGHNLVTKQQQQLNSTGKYIQFSVINRNGKEY